MEHQAFRYDFTLRELLFFLRKKKTCPACGTPLEQRKTHETRQGRDFNTGSDPFFVPNARVKHYIYLYHCPRCGVDYTLRELAK